MGCICSIIGFWLIGIGGEYGVPLVLACTLGFALLVAIPTSKMFGWYVMWVVRRSDVESLH